MRADPSKIIPTSVDTSEMWIEWHRSLKKWFSKNEANQHFLRFWNQRGGAGTDADTSELRSYMASQGVELTTTVGGDITDGFKGAKDWFVDGLNMTRAVVFGGVILAMGLITFYVVTSTKKGKSAGQIVGGLHPLSLGKKGMLKQLR